MKLIIIKLLILSIFTLAPSVSLAAPGAWTAWVKVHLIYTYTNGYLFVQLTPSADHINPKDCASKGYYQVPPDAKNFKEIYKMLLTAKAGGLRVSAYIDGCSGSYPRLHHLRTIQ